MRALEKGPADRYQSAEELRNDLEEFLDESGFRTGPRRMAIYLKQLFAPDAPVTDDGVAQARPVDPLAPAGGFSIAAAPTFGPKSLSAMAPGGQRAGAPSVWLILAIAVALTVLLGVGAMVFIELK